MDYATIQGIRSRTGIDEEQMGLFVIKELLDNALDFLEKNNILRKEVKVFVTREPNYIRIRVRNSNQPTSSPESSSASFSKDMIQSIFNYDSFYSTKRNLYKISRGALGDALKEVACIPYAIADRYDVQGWEEPFIITTSSGKRFHIRIQINKLEQTIHSEVKEVIDSDRQEEQKETTQDQHDASGYTEVEAHIPEINTLDPLNNQLKVLFLRYALLNTHVAFHFEFPGLKRGQDDASDANITVIDLPIPEAYAVPTNQKQQQSEINHHWGNLSSIHYYSLSDFKRFILGISQENENISVYDLISKNLREGSNIKKDKIPSITIGELKQDQQKIQSLYTILKYTLPPKIKLEVPFDRKIRRQSLHDRIERLGYKVTNIKYRAKQVYYKSEDGSISFPFLFEVAIVNTQYSPYWFLHVEGINCSPTYHTFLASSSTDTFVWKTRSNSNKINKARNIFEILEKCGYSYIKEKCKHPGAIVVLNLVTPRVEYKSYGKSDIYLEPFADTVADTAYRVSSSDGRNSFARGDNGNSNTNNQLTAEGLLTSLLEERLSQVQQDPSLKQKDRWTQSTVFYRLRPIMIKNHIMVTRRHITSRIKNICEEKLDKKREELGIIAADRAQLFFRGRWHDVGLDELPSLMKMGTDLLVIEKEGVAEVLSPFADKMGIALLNTRGFLTEYATMLSSLSKQQGCNVAILTDFDVSGLLLARKVPDIYRIGIDFDTLEYLRLESSEVEEDYTPDNNHIKPLEEIADQNGDDDLDEYLNFVTHKRIEIDSVLAKVGSKKFWDFLVSRLNEKFPTRNYNRAITIPKQVLPTVLEELVELAAEKVASFLKPEYERITKELAQVFGFITVDIKEKEKEIVKRLKDKIESDKDLKSFIKKIKDMKEEEFSIGNNVNCE
jgi:hypothetical protein